MGTSIQLWDHSEEDQVLFKDRNGFIHGMDLAAARILLLAHIIKQFEQEEMNFEISLSDFEVLVQIPTRYAHRLAEGVLSQLLRDEQPRLADVMQLAVLIPAIAGNYGKGSRENDYLGLLATIQQINCMQEKLIAINESLATKCLEFQELLTNTTGAPRYD